MLFKNREDAGHQLAEKITISNPENTVVLALPRGGVPLGMIVANTHHTAFDVILSKKIGHPQHPEYAIGAIAEEGKPLLSPEASYLDTQWLEKEVIFIREEMKRRRQLYDEVLEKEPIQDREIIIVDDGIATGLTMFSAIEAVKQQRPKSISIAVPVIPKDTYEILTEQVTEVYYIEVPHYFRGGVGAYYNDFRQVTDEEVQQLLMMKS